MLEWLIGALAAALGLSPAEVVGGIVLLLFGGSAALRWYRRTRSAENYYIDLARSGAAFQQPTPPQEAPPARPVVIRLPRPR
jgi:hypothetical protein